MPPLARPLCIAWCLAALHGLVWGDPLLVVVPEASPIQALTKQQLADIYLDRNATRSALAAVPLDREEAPLRDRYYQSLGIASSAVRTYWAKRVFTGRGRPPAAVSAADLATALNQQKNAMTYVEPQERPRHTRVVATLE